MIFKNRKKKRIIYQRYTRSSERLTTHSLQGMAHCVLAPTPIQFQFHSRRTGFLRCFSESALKSPLPSPIHPRFTPRIFCNYDDSNRNSQTQSSSLQLYRDIERLLTDTVRQSQGAWGSSSDWSQVEGAWILKPKGTKPKSVVHFIGGIFVGAAPQLTYLLVIATPYASGFDYFFIADEVQFKFDRCLRFLQETVHDLPTFGIGHSLGSVIHLLIGITIIFLHAIYPKMCLLLFAVIRLMNSLYRFKVWLAKERQCINGIQQQGSKCSYPIVLTCSCADGPKHWTLSITNCINTHNPHGAGARVVCNLVKHDAFGFSFSYFTLRTQAEMTLKQLESLSPPIMKQVLPLVEQLPPLYMDLVKGREDFTPKPEETRQLIKSYYGISRNLLIKFKDDTIDETPNLAQVLSSESAISSMLDMSIRLLPGDHGLPLQQALPDVPPAMADAVNRGSEFLANLSVGTPWETVAKEVSNTLGVDSPVVRAEISKDVDILVDVIISWMASNSGAKPLKP
ncbi:hypothetical protein CXB51_031501 [Gossypium anomalum]|uniref:Uncharacterized protein n=1 Tax=Gossypium anomalum TaxID=47600 RepID=A0A8J6CH38_9ROSI|nr:hypothetical protein CXB51_031501 [Gossypium anomalum]